ncbi:putative DNA-binding domain-containing protein [Novosphingobium ginsenosidimutans]|uniref:DUF2063 domain-containing protein n=1 Tax=Novosphingobium ginsenosidimutans TaxID=1176536 RepID=A0A5B8S1W5_9SPHN|nr:putative DNA-binding domain-containing protein [Novosphingobium ginsenosidimutans]QEA15042.1 DUF2063 domain-containing protein [Novosphingobium ginsenosidimutans]
MTLAVLQRAFLAEIAADDALPPSSAGMAIYRNAYRGRLSDALASGFERTKRWVGEEAFEQAAAHYILTNPPHRWTLDLFGEAFPDLLGTLFAEDPEVAELAWLEWQLQQAFAARNAPVLTAADLAEASLSEDDWARLRFIPAPGFAARQVNFDVVTLWPLLRDEAAASAPARLPESGWLIVWRQDLSPHYRLLDPAEGTALVALAGGESFGEVAARVGADGLPQFGAWFASWLAEGLFSALELT